MPAHRQPGANLEDWLTGSCRSQAKPAAIKITKNEQIAWCFLCIRIKLSTSPSRYICRSSSLTSAASLTRDSTVSKILGTRDADKVYNMSVNIWKDCRSSSDLLTCQRKEAWTDSSQVSAPSVCHPRWISKKATLLTKLCFREQPVGRGLPACPAVFCNCSGQGKEMHRKLISSSS